MRTSTVKQETHEFVDKKGQVPSPYGEKQYILCLYWSTEKTNLDISSYSL